jgi:hypothetical protein
MNQEIKKLTEHYQYCGRSFNRLNIEYMPISGKYSAQFYSCSHLRLATIYADSYDTLMSDISQIIEAIKNA